MADDEVLVCYSYTAARRYPLVIGKVGGFVLPTPLSPAQVAMLLGSFFGLLATRRLWGMVLPGGLSLLVQLAVPCGLAWAVRHLRMEGRSPVRMMFGQLAYAAAPRHGWARGRATRSAPRPLRVSQRIVIVPAAAPVDGPPAGRRTPNGPPTSAVVELAPPRWACLETGA
jgi:hypothetical protein